MDASWRMPPSSTCPTARPSPSGCRSRACARTSRCAAASTFRRFSALGPAPVQVGDVLPVGVPGADFPTVDHAAYSPDNPEGATVLEVLSGPRAHWVGGWATGLGGLLDVDRQVSGDSDRVGLRLSGSPVQRAAPWLDVELPSEGVVRGAVQVPPGGEPVVFLADHPVTGGYPVVGVLTASACDRAAQLRPGETVRLVRAASLS